MYNLHRYLTFVSIINTHTYKLLSLQYTYALYVVDSVLLLGNDPQQNAYNEEFTAVSATGAPPRGHMLAYTPEAVHVI